MAVNQIPSVNNLVDSVNLSRLETGQSLRIYDYDILTKKERIAVEQAGREETIKLLSGKERTLTKESCGVLANPVLVLNSEDIVVRADHEIISLAGIAETKKTGWTEQTKNILVEWSSFNSLQFKKTVQRLNILSSFSSPFFLAETFPRFISLLSETHTSNLDSEIIYTYQKTSPQPRLIRVNQTFLEKKLGYPLTTQQIENI